LKRVKKSRNERERVKKSRTELKRVKRVGKSRRE
jgi:hypothetical protein